MASGQGGAADRRAGVDVITSGTMHVVVHNDGTEVTSPGHGLRDRTRPRRLGGR